MESLPLAPQSFLSLDGGKTWQNRNMGAHEVLRGDYLIRLRSHSDRLTTHAEFILLSDMGVDHRRLEVGVTEEFLQRADVVSLLQEVCRKAVPHRVDAHRLGETAGANRFSNPPLQCVG